MGVPWYDWPPNKNRCFWKLSKQQFRISFRRYFSNPRQGRRLWKVVYHPKLIANVKKRETFEKCKWKTRKSSFDPAHYTKEEKKEGVVLFVNGWALPSPYYQPISLATKYAWRMCPSKKRILGLVSIRAATTTETRNVEATVNCIYVHTFSNPTAQVCRLRCLGLDFSVGLSRLLIRMRCLQIILKHHRARE